MNKGPLALLQKTIRFVVFVFVALMLCWLIDLSGGISSFLPEITQSNSLLISLGLGACFSYVVLSVFEPIPSLTLKQYAQAKHDNDFHGRYFQLQTLLDSIPLPVFYKNLDHVYLGCNELFATQFGYQKKDIIGKTSYDLSPPDIADQHHKDDDNVILKGTYVECETRMLVATGEVLDVIDHKSPIRDDNGEVLGLIAVIQDLTAQKKAERELHESETRFRDIADSSSEWAWETDIDGRITNEWTGTGNIRDLTIGLNPIGRTRKEISGKIKNLTDWTVYDEALSKTAPFSNFDYYALNHDGEKLLLQISGVPFFDDEGNYLGHRGVGADVTDIRQRENDVRVFDQRVRSAIEAISEGFILFDEQNKLVLVNNKYKEMYPSQNDLLRPGARFEDLIRASILAGEVPAAAGREEEWIAERLEQHEKFNRVSEQHLASGRWVKVSEQKIADGGNVGIRTDVTELKVAQIEAEASNRAKSEFLANMSHELRTPLNSMIGFSELMKNESFGPIGTPKYKEYSFDINSAGKHLLSLINDILNISKIEAGEENIEETEFPINEVVQSCLNMMSVRLREKELTLNQSIQRDMPNVYADQRQMTQILLNLLTNAVKFTPIGRSITITVRSSKDGGLDLIVADEGVGISETDLPKLTDPFFQVANATTRDHEGTGLGLALVKHLIEMHDGQLIIESKLGQGAAFTIHIPKERMVC